MNIILFIYLAVLGLHCCPGFSLVAASGGCSLAVVPGLLIWWRLLLWSTGSRALGLHSCSSWALEHKLSSCGPQA